MTNIDETMADDEEMSYRLTMRLGGETLATVELPCGHVVDLLRREDGARVWLDQAQQRATTPAFPEGVPFIDETVSAWHAGTLDVADPYGYRKQLVSVAERVDEAGAAVALAVANGGRTAQRRARRYSSQVKAERVALVRHVAGRTGIPLQEIADILHLHVRSVERMVRGEVPHQRAVGRRRRDPRG